MKIFVVIPCYRVKKHILNLLHGFDSLISKIIVVDDCCPEKTAEFVKQNFNDKRLIVTRNNKNLGVGGAVIKGYEIALNHGADVIVKIDGDGQMDPNLISELIDPILNLQADYVKGNRFFYPEDIGKMPKIRIIGNSLLSFLTKLSSGYWNIFDPTNGFTAISRNAAKMLPLNKISKSYFFESDILFRLNLLRAVVMDYPMKSKYENEKSNLKIKNVLFEFFCGNLKNFFKRIFYSYFLRDISLASFQLVIGFLFTMFGLIYGFYYWYISNLSGIASATGNVVLPALLLLLGLQFLLAFLAYDIASVPRIPLIVFNKKYEN